ncbi:MAG: flagellar filament capping protein FliD [Fibrobacterota bacterium]
MSEITNTSRITGMVSGFDTDAKVQDLMKAEKMRLQKVEQQQTWLEWKQEAYRGVTSDINELKNEFFDVNNKETNLRSPGMFAEFSASATVNGFTSSAVSVEGVSQMTDFTHSIESISQLATADTWQGAEYKTSLDGSGLNLASVESDITAGNDSFTLSFDGTAHAISLDGGYGGSTANLVGDLQGKIDSALGTGKIAVSDNGGELRLTPESGHSVTLYETDADILTDLGFTTGDKNIVDTGATIAESFGMTAGQDISVTVNDKNITFNTDDTVSSMMNTVNSSGAGVDLNYSSLENRFTMTSTKTGAANNISLTDTDSFFANELKITGATSEGQDAIFSLDGVETSRDSNIFTIDGGKYTLNQTYNTSGTQDPIDVNFETDTGAIVDKVKDFVDMYNTLVTDINERVGERRNYDYDPLTSDQKKAMEEDEVDLWQLKAKRGLLGGDTQLQSMTSQMRQALYESVEGVGISLEEIGIETSSNYLERGKLQVNEDKLTTALEKNYNQVVELFTKTSDVPYSDFENRSTRQQEEGLANRLHDIMQDHVRTTRDDNEKKGLLIEKAGIENDTTSTNNYFSKQLDQFNDRIADIEDYLAQKEEHYYSMFAAMEKAMSKMQSQSSALTNM